MQPQSNKKRKPPRRLTKADETHIPITVKGQRYVAPEGRHSQQTHRRAEARAAEAGHDTEKEQHAHDRTAKIDGIAETAAALRRNQEQSKPR